MNTTEVYLNGLIATPRRARKPHFCRHCVGIITADELYYSVTIGGGGLGTLKHPDRVHLECLAKFLRRGETW